VSLPAADDLFRGTRTDRPREHQHVSAVPDRTVDQGADRGAARERSSASGRDEQQAAPTKPVRRSSGRVRHDEKMTVYVTADELLDLEHARLALRRDQGLAVDRGRLVREAIAIVLADLDANGDDSVLVQRLTGR
jgi:hypothetical protein